MAAPDFFIRAAVENEVAVAVEIDNDACLRYDGLGMGYDIGLPDDHPFVVDEVRRWTLDAREGRLWFACAASGEVAGFAALGWAGERPHLDQLSVRRAWMRRGIGSALVRHAQRWSATKGELWLTTYERVPWNRPWYQKLGFRVSPASDWNSALREVMEREQAVLPHGGERVAMVYRHSAAF